MKEKKYSALASQYGVLLAESYLNSLESTLQEHLERALEEKKEKEKFIQTTVIAINNELNT